MSPLDDGKLYVARFDGATELDDGDGKGTGEWIELTHTDTRISGAGLTSQDKVLTYARLAADAVGATPMDRPEWSTIGTEGQVYWTLTNNNRKDDGQGELGEANPIFENTDGYIIETTDTSTTTFEWSLFILARNTRSPSDPGTAIDSQDFRFADYEAPADGGANVFTDPDAAYADPFGRLFIGTDGGQPDGLQDQLVVFDTNTGEYRRLLMGVNSDEITGLAPTPDFATLFTNTQHPGDGSPLATNFPAEPDGLTIPRDATIVIRRKDGGIVGS
jgi:secreted PhoX family phosphatase